MAAKGPMEPFERPDPERRSFAHIAATASIAAPVIAILLHAATHAAALDPYKLIAPLLALVLILGGFICAMIALCNLERFGRRGLLVRGIVGLLMNGGILGLAGLAFLSGFAQGVKARQSVNRQLTEAVED